MKTQNNANKWKITAIIFIILFVAENLLVIIGWVLMAQEERDVKECWYEICEEYEDAEYKDGVCFCYEYDMMGNPLVAKTEVMR